MIRLTYVPVIVSLLVSWNAFGLDFFELQRGETYALTQDMPVDVSCNDQGQVREFHLILSPFSSSLSVPDDNRYYVNAIRLVEKDIVQSVLFQEYRLQILAGGPQDLGPNCKMEVVQWPRWAGGQGRQFSALVLP